MSLTFDQAEAFLLSRGYRRHRGGKSKYADSVYQRKVRSVTDVVNDEGELFFSFDLFLPNAHDPNHHLSGWIQLKRDSWTVDIETFGFPIGEIGALLDGIEAEWMAISDLKVQP